MIFFYNKNQEIFFFFGSVFLDLDFHSQEFTATCVIIRFFNQLKDIIYLNIIYIGFEL